MMLAWIRAIEASVWVILSTRVAYEAAKEAVVAKNVRIVSIRAKKSLAERVKYCGGCAKVLGPAISDQTVGIEPEVCGEVEGITACGTEAGATGGEADGVEETGGDTGETGDRGPPGCSAIGDKSRRGLSSFGSSSSGPGGGRCKARGLARHRSTVRMVSQPRRRSIRGSAGNPICSST